MNIAHGREVLSEQGLNMVAVLGVDSLPAAFNSVVRESGIRIEDYASLLLIGHGGNRMWDALNEHGMAGANPVDEYSAACAVRFVRESLDDCPYRILYPGDIPIPLQQLGSLAGWHHASPLGIGINESWGPWFGYRAALLVQPELPVMTDLPSQSPTQSPKQSPCEQCVDKPCISVCPAGALSAHGAPDIDACVGHRLGQDSTCALQCLARLVCPVGERHRYGDEQVRYFYGRSLNSIRNYQTQIR